MSDTFEQELRAEIDAFRAEVREREIRREQERKAAAPDPFLSVFDVTTLDAGQIKALIAERYEHARLLNRLAAAEQRIAELERINGGAH